MIGALIGVGVAAAGAVTAAGYQSMAPTGQWYGRTFIGRTFAAGARGGKQIALTYDDGPNGSYTLRLLEVLAKHEVHATFFMIGRYVRENPETARRVASAGHVVGNHTYGHPLLIFKSREQARDELVRCREVLSDSVGEHSCLFRPPFGGRRPATLHVAGELGMKTVMWNVTGYDWNAPPAGKIERKVARRVRGGSIVLLHDGGHRGLGADRAQTVIATDHLIRRYKDEGYEFVTVAEMMGGRGQWAVVSG
jgi:peptidoglycan/xylan/chitin deacetylase (PgdA/CDA1 family)